MEINIDIDEIIFSCSKWEKRLLYKRLQKDDDVVGEEEKAERKREERFLMMEKLEELSPYELKKALCDLLGVGSYTDGQALRERLEPVINAG